jgi:nicotinate-nucleotide adenylyltransferase
MKREGKSYTSDTLRIIKENYPDAELWLLMGTDMFLTLHLWHEPEEVLKLAKICAFGRTEQDGEEVFAPQRAFLSEKYPGSEFTTITLPGLVDISSTQLREMLLNGTAGEYLLPAVYGYILMNGLYGVKPDLKHLDIPELRACSYSMVRNKRVPHIRGTEEEAVRLAKRWGADEVLARRAGILHDCTKYWELEPSVACCQKYGIEMDELEIQSPKLLHSKTGSAVAKHIFGEPEDVVQAIFCHTTGKPGMTTLDKILYLADYMEPNRDFDGVEEMRRLVFEDLDKAMILGLEMNVEDLTERGVPIHKNTQGTLDELRGRSQ